MQVHLAPPELTFLKAKLQVHHYAGIWIDSDL
jgi:hypothetical protein